MRDRGYAVDMLVDDKWWVGCGIGAPTIHPTEQKAREFARAQRFMPNDEVKP